MIIKMVIVDQIRREREFQQLNGIGLFLIPNRWFRLTTNPYRQR